MTQEKENGKCKQINKCVQILNLMLDNEATDEEEKFINNHLENCLECLEQYEVEKEFRSLIRKKLAQKKVPTELIQSIKDKIIQSA